MSLQVEGYAEQQADWPQEGRHILAQFDERSVVVYQAYRPSIGHYAAQHGHFGGDFSYERMSWVDPVCRGATGASRSARNPAVPSGARVSGVRRPGCPAAGGGGRVTLAMREGRGESRR